MLVYVYYRNVYLTNKIGTFGNTWQNILFLQLLL